MEKYGRVNIRIDPDDLAAAKEAVKENGSTLTEMIKLFLADVASHKFIIYRNGIRYVGEGLENVPVGRIRKLLNEKIRRLK